MTMEQRADQSNESPPSLGIVWDVDLGNIACKIMEASLVSDTSNLFDEEKDCIRAAASYLTRLFKADMQVKE